MTYATESAAWWAIAARLESPGATVGGLFGGLCDEICDLPGLTRDLRRKMLARIHAHLLIDETALEWPDDLIPASQALCRVWLTRPGEIEPRIIAATLLALECEDEEARA